jgi:hypothetical protein
LGSNNADQNGRLARRTANPIASIAHVSGESLERAAHIRRVHKPTSTVISRPRYYGQRDATGVRFGSSAEKKSRAAGALI